MSPEQFNPIKSMYNFSYLMIYETPIKDKTNDKMPPGVKVTSEIYPHKLNLVGLTLIYLIMKNFTPYLSGKGQGGVGLWDNLIA